MYRPLSHSLTHTHTHTTFLLSHCDQYQGSICGRYIRSDIDVYIDGKAVDGNYLKIIARVQSLLSDIQTLHSSKSSNALSSDLLDKCKTLAESVACHTVFPYCDPDKSEHEPTKRPICQNTCDAFGVGGVCESFINNQTSPDLYSRLMSNCDLRDNPAGESPACISVSLESTESKPFT